MIVAVKAMAVDGENEDGDDGEGVVAVVGDGGVVAAVEDEMAREHDGTTVVVETMVEDQETLLKCGDGLEALGPTVVDCNHRT